MTTMTDKGAKTDAAEAPAPAKKKGKKKLIIMVVGLLVVAGAAKFLLLGKAKPASTAPQPGPLVALDAVTVNLAGGHYLRVGVTVEFTSKVSASAPPDGSAATDQMISYFTGQNETTLETPAGIDAAKTALKAKIAGAYPKDPVYDILFTSFVVQ